MKKFDRRAVVVSVVTCLVVAGLILYGLVDLAEWIAWG